MTFLFPGLIVFLSAIISTSIGFGFALLSVPLLMLIYPPHLAITVSMTISLLTYLINLPHYYSYIDKKLISQLIIGTICGMPIGILIHINFDVHWLKMLVSVLILIITFLLIKGYPLPLPEKGASYTVGLLSGLLGSAVSLPGPPVILYLSSQDIAKKKFLGTTVTLFSFIYTVSLTVLYLSNSLPVGFWSFSLPLIPFSCVGIITGRILESRINRKVFRRLTYVVLVLSSCYSLISAVI